MAKFLGWMMTAIQVTAGQPARLPELFSVQHANSSTSPRSLYVYGEQLVMVIRYNKTLSATGAMGKKIARLLPVQVSQMLLEYLVLVRPVQIGWRAWCMRHQISPPCTRSSLW